MLKLKLFRGFAFGASSHSWKKPSSSSCFLLSLPHRLLLPNQSPTDFLLPIVFSRRRTPSSRPLKTLASRSDSNPDMASPPPSAPSTVLPSLVHKQIKFCQSCGGPTKQIIPVGDEKMRSVCSLCEKIYYENPKMVVGCLVEHSNKILLCRRKIQPSYGLWTLPAGYLEIGESAVEGAARETLEEACAEVEVLSPFAQLDIPRIGQYRAT